MGPVATAEVAAAPADESAVATPNNASPLALGSLAQGEGDDGTCTDETCTGTGDDGTGDDGTGDDGTGDDGTGDDGTGDDGTGDDGTGDDGTGDDGTGDDGTGDDGTGGEDTGDDSSVGDPLIDNVEVGSDGDVIVVTGVLTDNGGIGNVTLTLQQGTGTIGLNPDGTFTLNLTDTQGYSDITILATDADGNTTTYTFSYPG